jgi:cellulase/cellobiase CelA1
MTHAAHRPPAHRPRPGRRRGRTASLGAVLATLSLGLTGQLTAHPAAAETHLDTPFAGASFSVDSDHTDLVGTSVAQTPDAALRAKTRKAGGYPTPGATTRLSAVPA